MRITKRILWRCSILKVFLKIYQKTPVQVFPCEISKIFKYTYYVEHQWMVVFESLVIRKNYEKL